MILPWRKCYHVTKLLACVVLVVLLLGLFETWRGSRRLAGASTLTGDTLDHFALDYEQQIAEDEAQVVPGLGEGGVDAFLQGKEKKLGIESKKKLAMNVYLSDRISVNRSLNDFRHPSCKNVLYDPVLPSASVVVIFHNEPYSVLLRTVWSILNSVRRSHPSYLKANWHGNKTQHLGYEGQDPSSPYVYLKEIILVDDGSTLPELRGKLHYYVRTRLPTDVIKIVRLPRRRGLMQARREGARSAQGEVLVFLDAHCESQRDWLRPLLQRIRHKRDAVLTPLIDVIDENTFKIETTEKFQVGGFEFHGIFNWIDVPESEKARRGSEIEPTWSQTMAGGLFAINRKYFWEIGSYDEQMMGWGGENLEMSFRIWQCGGSLETIPCSRVGHVFRQFHPYGMPQEIDTFGINTARMAEVWMDEYKDLFYMYRPQLRNNPRVGDVTHRLVLREKLQCKPFQWYLDNVYPNKFVPVRDSRAYGRFRNPSSNLCLDTLQSEKSPTPLGLYSCHDTLELAQGLHLTDGGEIRDETRCATVHPGRSRPPPAEGLPVELQDCGGDLHRLQRWELLPSSQLRHVTSGLCLTSARGQRAAAAAAAPCDAASAAQRWAVDYSEDNGYRTGDGPLPLDLEEALSKMRLRHVAAGNNKSRPLPRRRRSAPAFGKSSSSSKRRSRFLLTLIPPSTASAPAAPVQREPLDAILYSESRTLHPDDLFVRDLVNILNGHNVTVINNGHVFQNGRVTSLSAQSKPNGWNPDHKHKPNPLNRPHPTSPPPDGSPHTWEGGSEVNRQQKKVWYSCIYGKGKCQDGFGLVRHWSGDGDVSGEGDGEGEAGHGSSARGWSGWNRTADNHSAHHKHPLMNTSASGHWVQEKTSNGVMHYVFRPINYKKGAERTGEEVAVSSAETDVNKHSSERSEAEYSQREDTKSRDTAEHSERGTGELPGVSSRENQDSGGADNRFRAREQKTQQDNDAMTSLRSDDGGDGGSNEVETWSDDGDAWTEDVRSDPNEWADDGRVFRSPVSAVDALRKSNMKGQHRSSNTPKKLLKMESTTANHHTKIDERDNEVNSESETENAVDVGDTKQMGKQFHREVGEKYNRKSKNSKSGSVFRKDVLNKNTQKHSLLTRRYHPFKETKLNEETKQYYRTEGDMEIEYREDTNVEPSFNVDKQWEMDHLFKALKKQGRDARGGRGGAPHQRKPALDSDAEIRPPQKRSDRDPDAVIRPPQKRSDRDPDTVIRPPRKRSDRDPAAVNRPPQEKPDLDPDGKKKVSQNALKRNPGGMREGPSSYRRHEDRGTDKDDEASDVGRSRPRAPAQVTPVTSGPVQLVLKTNLSINLADLLNNNRAKLHIVEEPLGELSSGRVGTDFKVGRGEGEGGDSSASGSSSEGN